MIFSTILVALLFIGLIIVNKKYRTKKVRIISLVAFLVMFLAIMFFPLESFFMTYNSPEELCESIHKGEIATIIEGEDSCLVIFKEGNEHYYIPKTDNGYKMPSSFVTKKYSGVHNAYENMMIYNVRNTNDYYIVGYVMRISTEKPVSLYDSNGKETDCEVYTENSQSILGIDCYVNEFPEGYYFIVNGINIPVT